MRVCADSPLKNLTRASRFLLQTLTFAKKRGPRVVCGTAKSIPERSHPGHFATEPPNIGAAGPHALLTPEESHLCLIVAKGTFPKPLTFFPAPTHHVPRTPSPRNPARPHHRSRKASPCRRQSLTWQGFALALTFLTRVQGCLLLLLSSSAFARVPEKDPRHHPLRDKRWRETVS
jgi:hypothetical protein